MGREIKRVAFDFNWPLNKVWIGFINPYHSMNCPVCEGQGFNVATRALENTWYSFDYSNQRWCDKITQDEVDALIAQGRLMDFTHTWTPGVGWKKIEPAPIVTAEMVNDWERSGVFGHDAINRWICVETRAKRMGIYGVCEFCKGEGEIWANEEVHRLHDAWKDYEPPAGEGWQVWETVSEGSPISPVCDTRENLVEWLVRDGYTREAADAFSLKGWVPSIVITEGKIYNDIESAAMGGKDQQ
jgi:hypothetical protein